MSYKNGRDILPEELLKELQKYIQGELIYIPREESTRKAWGENSGIRSFIKNRNYEIYNNYKDGCSIYELMDIYNLSEDSIRKIVYKVNRERMNSNRLREIVNG